MKKLSNEKNILKNNYKTIIGVSLLAFLFWFMIKMNKVYEYPIDVPIRFVNLDQDQIFKFPVSAMARVEFSGKGRDLMRLPFYEVEYQIDMSGVPMHFEINLSEHPEYINFPHDLNVEVKSIIRPRVLVVDMDEKTKTKLPVEVAYELQTPPGYILVDVNIIPDSVSVTAPKEMFENTEIISTELKKFTNVSKVFREKFSIKSISQYYSKYEPSVIEVLFNVQRLAEKEVLNVPVKVINKPPDIQVIPLPSFANIYVKGGERILADLESDDFNIIIDFRIVWAPGKKKVKADLYTDASILYMETRPSEFELIVQKGKSD